MPLNNIEEGRRLSKGDTFSTHNKLTGNAGFISRISDELASFFRRKKGRN